MTKKVVYRVYYSDDYGMLKYRDFKEEEKDEAVAMAELLYWIWSRPDETVAVQKRTLEIEEVEFNKEKQSRKGLSFYGPVSIG